MEFQDKTVVVTGSTQGIGREIAMKFAAEGANLIVNGINVPEQEELAKSACAEIEKLGGHGAYILGDVSKPEDTDALIKFAMEKNPRLLTFGYRCIIVFLERNTR